MRALVSGVPVEEPSCAAERLYPEMECLRQEEDRVQAAVSLRRYAADQQSREASCRMEEQRQRRQQVAYTLCISLSPYMRKRADTDCDTGSLPEHVRCDCATAATPRSC